MATHKLAILVSAVGAAKAAKDLKGVDSAVSSIGAKGGQGVRTAAKNIAGLGLIAAGGIALAVRSGLQDLATLESAVTSVDGAIKQVGLTGQVSGAQIAGWANQIESDIGAAFDDKDIVAATTTLIRYGKVTKSNLKPAMKVMTDLAAKTGSVESASALLAKALADPTKAAGKLARAGVILTDQQQKQIKALVKGGHAAEAQKVILDALAKSTAGAAAASQGPYQRALSTLSDVSEDARKALAEGFLPVIEKVADLLSSELAKPQTMNNIREFGQGLAKGLDSLIEIARNLPWGAIGDSLKIAGAGGKAVLEAFTNLPPWVQTAVLSGWGLNKLSGGALGGIVGELGKGLIKGVLGMNAGVVNINAGVVNGGGGVPGAAAGAAGAGALTTGLALTTAVVAPLAVAAAGTMIQDGLNKQAAALNTQASNFAKAASDAQLESSIAGMQAQLDTMAFNTFDSKNKVVAGMNTLIAELNRRHTSTAGADASDPRFENRRKDTQVRDAIDKSRSDTIAEQIATRKAVDDAKAKAAIGFLAGSQATQQSGNNIASVTRSGTSGTTAATNVGSSRIVSAIASNRPIITTTVNVNVSAAQVTKSTTTQERYGPGTGSGGSGSNGANKPT